MSRRISKRESQVVEWGIKGHNGTALVYSANTFSANASKYQVKLENKWCSCFKWQQTGIPCKHAIACLVDLPDKLV